MTSGRSVGTGRQARLRTVWSNPWRFKSSLRHTFSAKLITNMGLLYLILFLVRPIIAQEPTPQSSLDLYRQYKTDYFYQYNIYQTHLNQYSEKKQIDLTYKSITTQKEKNEAFVKAFISRNLSLETYCRTLRVKLEINKSINPDNTQQIQDKLKDYEKLLLKMNQDISDTDISNNQLLSEINNDFQDKYEKELKPIINSALVEDLINYNLTLIDTINNLTHIINQENENRPDVLHVTKVISTKSQTSKNEVIRKSLLEKEESTAISSNSYGSSIESLEIINNNILEMITELKSSIK